MSATAVIAPIYTNLANIISEFPKKFVYIVDAHYFEVFVGV